MKHIIILLWLSLSIFFAHLAGAQESGDGIPDNCEQSGAAYYQANVFPRYESPSSRVVLVDWTTGADVRELETGLVTSSFQVQGWSADCRYLAGAIVNAAGNYDTVVWDAVNGGRVGTVADARGVPHHIYWSPDSDYLIVETRSGGILWNLDNRTQITLTTAWDGYGLRNFSRFYWGETQLTFTPVGEFAQIYDYASGQITILPTPTLASLCSSTWYGSIIYNTRAQQIEINSGWRGQGQTLYVIESNIDLEDFEPLTRSADCRYFAASLKVDSRTWETVVWDTTTGERAAVFTDARTIPHVFIWSPVSGYAVIQTRHGGYLWHIPTDTRTLLTDAVDIESSYYDTRIRNFYLLNWEVERGQLFTVTAANPGAITVFDMYSGVQVAFYPTEIIGPVNYFLSEDDSLLVVHTNSGDQNLSVVVFNLATGTSVTLRSTFEARVYSSYYQAIFLSPDNRYIIAFDEQYREPDTLQVWDLQNVNADGSPTYSHHPAFFRIGRLNWYSPTVIRNLEGRAWDIITGELIYLTVTYADQPVNSQPAQTSGFSSGSCFSSSPYYRNLFTRYDGVDDTRVMLVSNVTGEEWLLVDASSSASLGAFSPDCRYVHVYIDRYSTNQSVVVYDTSTMQQVANPLPDFVIARWSPDGERVIIGGGYGEDYWREYYIWQPQTGNLVPLLPNYGSIPGASRFYWDYERGQVLVGLGTRVWVFDLLTGQQRYEFVGSTIWMNNRQNTGYFFVSGDWVFIHGNYVLALFNLNTLENTMVIAHEDTLEANRSSISPDGRYLVAGGTMLRVWDLQNLPRALDLREPNLYNGPSGYIVQVIFVDNTTVEVTTQGDEVSYWDVTTGTQITR